MAALRLRHSYSTDPAMHPLLNAYASRYLVLLFLLATLSGAAHALPEKLHAAKALFAPA